MIKYLQLERCDSMNILFIGDIFGEEGLNFLEKHLPKLKVDNKINYVIVNAENVSFGRGMHYTHYNRLMKMGVNMVTMGNHAFSNHDILNFIDKSNIVRPANIPTDLGVGYKTVKYNNETITIINLLGRAYHTGALDCPFRTLDHILSITKSDYYIVDMHADATAEKIALGLDFDGKVSAVLGTHTHVPTADERVLPLGTLYITDVGMTGPRNGVIGNTKEDIIQRFRTGVYERAGTEKGVMQLNAVLLELGQKRSIRRIHIEE